QLLVSRLALPPRPFVLFQRLSHRADLLDLLLDLLLLAFDHLQTSVDTPRQPGQLTVPWPRLVQLQVPLQRGTHLLKRLAPAQARRAKRPALVVVEDAAQHRAVVQHHLSDRILGGRAAPLLLSRPIRRTRRPPWLPRRGGTGPRRSRRR